MNQSLYSFYMATLSSPSAKNQNECLLTLLDGKLFYDLQETLYVILLWLFVVSNINDRGCNETVGCILSTIWPIKMHRQSISELLMTVVQEIIEKCRALSIAYRPVDGGGGISFLISASNRSAHSLNCFKWKTLIGLVNGFSIYLPWSIAEHRRRHQPYLCWIRQ